MLLQLVDLSFHRSRLADGLIVGLAFPRVKIPNVGHFYPGPRFGRAEQMEQRATNSTRYGWFDSGRLVRRSGTSSEIGVPGQVPGRLSDWFDVVRFNSGSIPRFLGTMPS